MKEAYGNILKDVNRPLHSLAVKFNNFVEHPFDAFVKGISAVSDFRNLKVIYDSSLVDISFDDYLGLKDKANILEIFENLTHPDNADLYAPKPANKGRIEAKDDIANKLKKLKADLNNWSVNFSDLK